MTDWQPVSTPDIPADLSAFAGDQLLAQLLAQRGLTTVTNARAFLDPDAYQPTSPFVLPDMEAAVARLSQAIARQEAICVWGDFDVDGQTATTLLVSALAELGARVRYYIPNRLTESHGIKPAALSRLLAEGVDLILTCDTGVGEHEAIATARAAGVEVVVTDHHDLSDTLPPAGAVVNPKRLPAGHPLRELPGVGVAYKLAEALYENSGRSNRTEPLLDLVALGIVADVAQQTGDTRYLLQRGLLSLQHTARPGLQAVIESANLKAERLTEEHIGFWLAPRLNALGRLGDANLGVELLTTSDRVRARIIALQLEALNDRRKLLVDRVVVQALGQLEDNPALADYQAIVLAAADWHPGVIGIAASRLVEQYRKPAILIALRPDGLGRGSARSVAGCDIHGAIKTQADRLIGFGGHPMAAGLTIAPEHITLFRRGVSTALAGCQPGLDTSPGPDLVIELAQATGSLLKTIQRLAPFGAGNPPVLVGCRGLKIVAATNFGKTRDHKRLVVEDEAGCQQEVIRWRGATEPLPQGAFDLAFTLSPDDFKGGGAVQLEWVTARTGEPAAVVREPDVTDWRQFTATSRLLAQLKTHDPEETLIWAEGVELPNLETVGRHRLRPAESLVIWTAPPGQDILQQALATVNPDRIIVVGRPAAFDTFPAMIRQLMGLVKYAVSRRDGELILSELAATLGQRPATARLGLDWLASQGKLSIVVEEEDLLVLRFDQRPPAGEAATIEVLLKSALAETEAYRQFFKGASLATLRQSQRTFGVRE
jgi:single-stranded-DNA-specific exonuclease